MRAALWGARSLAGSGAGSTSAQPGFGDGGGSGSMTFSLENATVGSMTSGALASGSGGRSGSGAGSAGGGADRRVGCCGGGSSRRRSARSGCSWTTSTRSGKGVDRPGQITNTSSCSSGSSSRSGRTGSAPLDTYVSQCSDSAAGDENVTAPSLLKGGSCMATQQW